MRNTKCYLTFISACVENEGRRDECYRSEDASCTQYRAYVGTKSTTRDGRRCQNWRVAKELDPENDYVNLPGFGDHNYCRADAYLDVDDDDDGYLDPPWCMIANPKEGELDWDYCFPSCKGIRSLVVVIIG